MHRQDRLGLSLCAMFGGLVCVVIAWLSRHDAGAGWFLMAGAAMVVGGAWGACGK